MDRREFLQWGAAAAGALTQPVLAQPALAQPALAETAPAAAAGPSGLVIYSRPLQWLRTPAQLAQACVDIGLDHLDLTVVPYPGHVDPARAKSDLPAFAAALKQGGISVPVVTTAIVDADSPNAEAVLDAASSAGIANYVWGGLTYDTSKPYQPQLDALKPRVQTLARLNEKYKIRGLYHPVMGAANVGSAFFDILDLLKDFDPKFVGIQYDTGSLLQPVRDVFVSHMRIGAPYIGGMALNDGAITLDIPVYEYGPFDPDSNADANAGPAGDNTGNDNGDPLAFGGGGRPLPYHFHPMRVGTGMIDLILIGRTIKQVGFNGPIEWQVAWPLGGAENGADKVTLARQSVLGQLKRDRLTIEHGFFAAGWNIDIARPAFQVAGRGAKPGDGSAPARGNHGGRAAPGPGEAEQ